MATLLRERPVQESATSTVQPHNLNTNIPAPFPKDFAQQLLTELAEEQVDLDTNTGVDSATKHYAEIHPQDIFSDHATGDVEPDLCIEPSPTIAPRRLSVDVLMSEPVVDREVGPSLAQVKQSCLMTLNNLLSQHTDGWQTIVPSRRHSLPAQSPTNTSANFQALLNTASSSSSSALQTLVSNLRHRDEPHLRDPEGKTDADLLEELEARVSSLVDSGSIQSRDARLAQSLVSLLAHLIRLSIISPDLLHRSPIDTHQSPSSTDIYDTLRRQVSELQTRRDAQSSSGIQRPPVEAVEHAVIWSKIDGDLEEVFRLCRERADPVPHDLASLPPDYDYADYEPPTYDPAEYSETAAAKVSYKSCETPISPQLQNGLDEKMRLDLEAVTMAIDRLYLVAPQLANQRVELKRSKLEQMEQARVSGSNVAGEGAGEGWRAAASRRKGKAKEILGGGRERSSSITSNKGDMRDLEKMLDLIGKASNRRIDGQSVILDGQRGMADRVEKARLRDLEKRNAFHERLITHSNSRRLTSQDATLNPIKTKNPDTLLTLPEFIREAMPDSLEQARDPEALLTLPEFVREAPPITATPTVSSSPPSAKLMRKQFKPYRSRSLSAPPLSLAWLLPGASATHRTSSPLADVKNSTSNGATDSILRAGLDVQYVAEYQDNLGSIAVFFQVNGTTQAGADIEAEVAPSGGGGGERLVVKSGASMSAPLALPARVTPGKKEVKIQSGGLEVKLECTLKSSPNSRGDPSDAGVGLLDAAQLETLNPTTFICASCSLPLVQSSRLTRYDALPSEYWEELLEAWMCHSDQKLSDRVARYANAGEDTSANGLWPRQGQALVGGSYLLFPEDVIVMGNVKVGEEGKERDMWKAIRCICGAITGRCKQHVSFKGPTQTTTYRLAKYAIRPVSPSSDPLKIPLSAFILQDMDELVQAHASYRFVVLDEEEEKPRILLWMFKPHIRISYAASNHYFMARSSSIQAAKVHFKILGPSVSPTLKSTIEKYPGFGQSERLLYPLDVCRRIAGLLKESNAAYPQGRRVMGGLDVGWLLRV